VKSIANEVITEISKIADIKGFRKGHAPRNLIKAKYKDAIKEEVARNYVNRYLNEILEKENLKPVVQEVYFGEVELEGEEKIKFKVSFEVAPEFELKPYEGIEVETVKVEVRDEDVEKYVQNLLERNVKYEAADKEVEEGDQVKIKYHITAKSGEEEEDEFEVIIGTGMLRPEIEQQLKGKKASDKVVIEDSPLYNEKGEEIGKAKIEIEILEVRRKVLPEFNDEFVKSIGLAETAEEAKQKIREDIQKQLETLKKQDIQQRILDKIASEYDFPVPSSLLEKEVQNLASRYAQQLESYGIKPNREMIEAAAEGLTKTGINNIRVMFVLTKIAEKEGIEITEEELNQEIERLAKIYNTTPADLRSYFEERNMIEAIKSDIRRQKALDLITQKANIKELTKEELEQKAQEEQKQSEEQNG
ncbi:MAG: trigger factor, partial [Hydrogenothermaceae bacterium]